jgi:hypothetical protein
MRTLISLIVVAAVACIVAIPASAQPTDNGPVPAAPAHHATAAVPTGDDGTPAYVYALIGCGAALALGAGGFAGARSAARHVSPRAS